MRPRLLDLFCGAGGAGMGYHRAGFEVVGVDISPQPRYPFEFHQGSVLDLFQDVIDDCWHLAPDKCLGHFDAVHASPPCQNHSQMSTCRPGLADEYPNLIPATRELLNRASRPLDALPWVIENVPGAPLRADITLCGQMFGLPLYRHRIFETNVAVHRSIWVRTWQPEHLAHVTPGSKAGHWKPGQIISVSGHCSPISLARQAMGIDWTNRHELAEAIPPAYTEHIGRHLIDHLLKGT